MKRPVVQFLLKTETIMMDGIKMDNQGNLKDNQKYYTSGQFARMSHVTLRTIRYYDKQKILKPSFVNDSGARFYTDKDFVRLQQILLLKYVGFTLEDIRDITIGDTDYLFLLNSLKLQGKLVQDKIEQLQLVDKAVKDTTQELERSGKVDWSKLLSLIHLTKIENSLVSQYKNSSNISARINLHHNYAKNKYGWFPWIYDQCGIRSGNEILELGCGNGALWLENYKRLPENIMVTLTDQSEGMLRDVRRMIGADDVRFAFEAFDCSNIPFPDASFDLVIANHVLFYCKDIAGVCREAARVLKPQGHFICSTYGADHMKEITSLVQSFDDRIVLSEEPLYQRFGMENGEALLKPFFDKIVWQEYEDELLVDAAEPLIEYIISCHGNQNRYILDRMKEFRGFVNKKLTPNFRITKRAGIFICKYE